MRVHIDDLMPNIAAPILAPSPVQVTAENPEQNDANSSQNEEETDDDSMLQNDELTGADPETPCQTWDPERIRLTVAISERDLPSDSAPTMTADASPASSSAGQSQPSTHASSHAPTARGPETRPTASTCRAATGPGGDSPARSAVEIRRPHARATRTSPGSSAPTRAA